MLSATTARGRNRPYVSRPGLSHTPAHPRPAGRTTIIVLSLYRRTRARGSKSFRADGEKHVPRKRFSLFPRPSVSSYGYWRAIGRTRNGVRRSRKARLFPARFEDENQPAGARSGTFADFELIEQRSFGLHTFSPRFCDRSMAGPDRRGVGGKGGGGDNGGSLPPCWSM